MPDSIDEYEANTDQIIADAIEAHRRGDSAAASALAQIAIARSLVGLCGVLGGLG